MSDEDGGTYYSPPEHPASKEIADLVRERAVIPVSNGSPDDLPDDVGMELLSEAGEICTKHGVPLDERVDVICAGHRYAYERHLDGEVAKIRYQLEGLFSIYE